MRKFTARVIAASALALLAVTPASADFDKAQRDEIGTIIRDYLMENPEVLRDAFQALERKLRLEKTEQAKKAIVSHADELFRSKDDLVIGNPKGSVTMVEFMDYNCGYCKRSFPALVKLVENDKNLKIVIKEFPVLGPGSMAAAQAAVASAEQGKYWAFHQAMIETRGAVDLAKVLSIAKSIGLDIDRLKKDMASDKVASIIARNMQAASALGIEGTPAFIIDDTLIPGAVEYEALAAAVAAVRKNGGCKVC